MWYKGGVVIKELFVCFRQSRSSVIAFLREKRKQQRSKARVWIPCFGILESVGNRVNRAVSGVLVGVFD